jgi:hypothetical protein
MHNNQILLIDVSSHSPCAPAQMHPAQSTNTFLHFDTSYKLQHNTKQKKQQHHQRTALTVILVANHR